MMNVGEKGSNSSVENFDSSKSHKWSEGGYVLTKNGWNMYIYERNAKYLRNICEKH